MNDDQMIIEVFPTACTIVLTCSDNIHHAKVIPYDLDFEIETEKFLTEIKLITSESGANFSRLI
jgi:hypothetical protein